MKLPAFDLKAMRCKLRGRLRSFEAARFRYVVACAAIAYLPFFIVMGFDCAARGIAAPLFCMHAALCCVQVLALTPLSPCWTAAFVAAFSFAYWFASDSIFAVLFFAVCILLMAVSRWIRPYPLLGKGVFRYLLIGTAVTAFVCLITLFILLLRSIGPLVGTFAVNRAFFVLLFAYLLSVFISAWGFSVLGASSDPRVFSRVLAAEGLLDPAPFSSTDTAETLFINALMRPACFISRIREHVEPSVGSFRVHSEIEYEIPENLRSLNDLYLPVVFQGKCELSRDLRVSGPASTALRRIDDDGMVELFCDAIAGAGANRGWPSIAQAHLHRFAREAFKYIDGETDADFSRRWLVLSEEMNLTDSTQKECLASLFMSLRYVKPICYEVHSGDTPAWNRGYVTIEVDRMSPLVPVRSVPSSAIERSYLKAKRLFTKKRLHFYYGLGGADCARSYHLSMAGPPKTYLSSLSIARTGGETEFYMCEDIRISSRYSQKLTRVYIKRGRGFSHAALDIGFEMRLQRPVATSAVTAIAVLLTIAYLFVSFVGGESCKVDVFKPLSVLSIGTIFSAWQAMDEYRAEEWLWLCIAVVAAASFVSIIMSMLTSLKLLDNDFPVVIIWGVCLVASFASAVATSVALFSKIKLHGAVMDRVPKMRRAHPHDLSSSRDIEFSDLINKQQEMLSSVDENDDTFHYSGRALRAEEAASKGLDMDYSSGLNRDAMYAQDIMQYRCLMSDRWSDGWLMTNWMSSINPYRLPSKLYCKAALDLIKQQSSE